MSAKSIPRSSPKSAGEVEALFAAPLSEVDPEINDVTANAVIQQLLYLQYDNKTQEIHFYINSPGGDVSATLAIYDTMQFLECPIATYCMGLAASMGVAQIVYVTIEMPAMRLAKRYKESHGGSRGVAVLEPAVITVAGR